MITSSEQEKVLDALRASLEPLFQELRQRCIEAGRRLNEHFKKLVPAGSFMFEDTRYCNQRKGNVTFMACLGCWHLKKYPQGFNFKGCQLAHITPPLQGLAYGGYGAVGDYEERTSR